MTKFNYFHLNHSNFKIFINFVLIVFLLTIHSCGNFISGEGSSDDEMWEGESEEPWVEENAHVQEKNENESEESPRIYPGDQDSYRQPTKEEILEKAPKMHPEDSSSFYMPEYYWCDACRIVAYQIIETIDEAHKKRPSIKRISEMDLIDILEGLCEDGFEGYGMVEHNGVNRLAGPGLETENTDGYRITGGRWTQRLRIMCGEYMGDIGEVEIYNNYLKYKDLFTSYLCQGPGIRNKCGEIDYSKYNKDEL